MKLGAYRQNDTTINLLDRDTGEDVASRAHEPGKEDETYEALMPLCNAVSACDGLDLPEDCPPGILAELVTAARELANTITGFGMKCPNVPIRVEGETLAAILAKLAPAGSPDNGKPVSPPEPRPQLPFEKEVLNPDGTFKAGLGDTTEPTESGVRYPEGQPSGHGHTPLEHRIANY
jgi:hypothetical protein